VEVNTIAVAFAGMTENLSRLHAEALQYFRPESGDIQGGLHALQSNTPCQGFAKALAEAHAVYCASRQRACKAVVCFMTFQDDHLELDQRLLEASLLALGVRSRWVRFNAAEFELCETGAGSELWLEGEEISVVYFHAGYSPEHYSSEQQWTAREMIEQSCAVKVPSAAMQLAGCKRIQEVLTRPTELRRFLRDEAEVAGVCRVCATQVDPSSSDPAAVEAVKDARADPDSWVLKPQREGGGNNLYSADLEDALAHKSSAELAGFVLMKKINALPSRTAMMCAVAGDEPSIQYSCEVHPVVGELGIFSAMLMSGERTVLNTVSGLMVRTKCHGEQEGGVCQGCGILDTPLLV